jgi:hypothetical protein
MPIQIETIDGFRDGTNLAKPINDLQTTELRYLQDGLLDEPTILVQRGPVVNDGTIPGGSTGKPEGGVAMKTPLSSTPHAAAIVVQDTSDNDRTLKLVDASFTSLASVNLSDGEHTSQQATVDAKPALKAGAWIGYSEKPDGKSLNKLMYWRGGLADYSTGSISLTRGSKTVTGTGTSWTSAMVGCWLWSETSDTTTFHQFIGVVAAVNSTTSITLDRISPYTGDGASPYKLRAVRPFIPLVSKGRITTSTTSTTVTGASTKFKDQKLDVGTWDIFKLDNTYVGTVSSVATNVGLTLSANAAVALTNDRFYAYKRFNSNVYDDFDLNDSSTPKVGFMNAVHANRQWYAHRAGRTSVSDVADWSSRLWYSDTNDPEFVDLAELDGDYIDVVNVSGANTPIMAIAPSYNALVVLKQNECHGIFGDTPSQFNRKKLYDDGALHGMSVQAYEGGVIWAGKNGIYFFDGTQVDNLTREKLGEWYTIGVKNFDPDTDRMSSAIVNDHYILHISDFVPTRGPNKSTGDSNLTSVTIVLNLRTRAYSFLTNVALSGWLEFPPQASSPGVIFLLQTSGGGVAYRAGRLFTDTGLDTVTCSGHSAGPKFYLEAPKFAMGDPQLKKLIKQVQCLYKAVGDDLRLETIVGLNETATLASSKFLEQSTYRNKRIKFLKRSQYLSFRLYPEDNTMSELRIGPMAIGFKFQRPGRV